MSNLGGYQKLTTCAKKVGGPIPLIMLLAGGGMAVGGIAVGCITSNSGKTLISKKIKALLSKRGGIF